MKTVTAGLVLQVGRCSFVSARRVFLSRKAKSGARPEDSGIRFESHASCRARCIIWDQATEALPVPALLGSAVGLRLV